MAVYYKFKSAKDYDSVAIDGHFMSVANLKERIYESKHLGSGTDFDLMVTNAQTNEEYLDEAMLIPKNTSVLIRRVPGRPRMNIVAEQDDCRSRVSENKAEDAQPAKSSYPVPEPFLTRLPEDSEWDEFGSDLYSIPEVLPVLPSNAVQDAPPHNKADEDSKIKALIDTSALDWQRQTQDGFGSGRGFGRGMVGRMMGGRGLGRGGFERKTPPMGYICHRCKVPGHFIQHCPTNGDPNYDVKRVKPPTGIPKSMLMATPDGSYALPSGAVAVLKPNEAAFEKEMEGLPTTQSLCDLPPELRCPLCVDVMKDAVLTSKCCLKSFCDKCIRNHILSKSTCICGATNILVDYLLPNKTLRDTINRVLGSNNNNVENAGNVSQIQDMESARPKVSSPALSATSKGDSIPPAARNVTSDLKDPMTEYKATVSAPQPLVMKGRSEKNMGIPEAARESVSMKETTSQGSAPLPADEVQQKLQAVDPGKKKKKKKACLPLNAADMQWRTSQDFAPENYMMPPCPSAYNPYWAGMQLGMDGYPPYSGAMPYMGYAPSPFDVPFGGFVPQDPFVGGQGYMLPAVPPQRNLSEFVMGANPVRPIMSREQFEARKADLRKKQEMERHVESREYSRGRGGGREAGSSCDVSSMKSKPMSMPRVASAADRPHHHPNQRMEKPLSPVRLGRDSDSTRFGKKKSEPYRYPDDDYYPNNHRHQSDNGPRASAAVAAEKSSVFSRISFADGGSKRKLTSSIGASKEVMANGDKDYEPSSASPRNRSSSSFEWKSPAVASLGTGGPRRSVADYDSSDDERHFKRRPSRYEPLPPPVEREDEARPSRSSRSRQQEQDGDERGRGRSNKHR